MSNFSEIIGIRCGENQPGAYRIWAFPSEHVIGTFPTPSNITVHLLNSFPELIPGTTIVEFFATPKTLKFDEVLKGPLLHQSWEQSAELKIAGYNAQQCDAIERLLNVSLILVIELWDGLMIALGTSDLGLDVEVTHTSGAAGSDRREWSLKMKNDNYGHGYLPFSSYVKFPNEIKWEMYSIDFNIDFASL